MWYKDIKYARKFCTTFIKIILRFPSTLFFMKWPACGLDGPSAQGWPCAVYRKVPLNENNMRNQKKTTFFMCHYLCNYSTFDIGRFAYVDVNQPEECSGKVWQIPSGWLCMYRQKLLNASCHFLRVMYKWHECNTNIGVIMWGMGWVWIDRVTSGALLEHV